MRLNNQKNKFTRSKNLLNIKNLLIVLVIVTFFSTIIVLATKKDISDTVINKTSLPNLKGEIVEKFNSDDSIGTDDKVKKEVTIKNTGNMNLFVRVLVLAEIENSEGIQLPANIRKLNEVGKTTGQIELIGGTSDVWLDGGDDFFYYNKKLAPDEVSEPLFTEVKIADSVLKADVNPINDKEVYYFSYGDSKLKISIKEETITSIGDAYQSAWNMKKANGEFTSPIIESISKILDKEKE